MFSIIVLYRKLWSRGTGVHASLFDLSFRLKRSRDLCNQLLWRGHSVLFIWQAQILPYPYPDIAPLKIGSAT